MKVAQKCYRNGKWAPSDISETLGQAQLVLVFGGTNLIKTQSQFSDIASAHPSATIIGCSTSGEICGDDVLDDSLVVTSVEFEHTRLKEVSVNIADHPDSRSAGQVLARQLESENLVHFFVLSDGLDVNGSELVHGIFDVLPQHVTVTGGLSGDGDRFSETYVVTSGQSQKGGIVGVGLYSDRLKVGCGSLGGWDPFGPERIVTRSEGNVLYEMDGRSALSLYKDYLGDHADGLPATGLLFPLSLRLGPEDTPVVRTILAVDEDEQSLTFAGDVPEGHRAQLMKANFDRLVDGAVGAARITTEAGANSPDLAILISCVGRKLVLKQRIEDEVEGVRSILGGDTTFAGFYSYGEISPFTPNAKCELHNQTMTITTFSEE